MKLIHTVDRAIHGLANHAGRLEIIDDVHIEDAHRHQLLDAFTVPTHIVGLVEMGRNLWELIEGNVPRSDHTVFLCPGNGAWLVERALGIIGVKPGRIQPVNISRESNDDIVVHGIPDHIVVLEDVVETGETARKILSKLHGANCPVTLASTLWHDRATQTEQVLDAFAGYHQVLVAERIRSDHPLDDIRSLSTLSRKATIPKNQRYSVGRETAFLDAMQSVPDNHDWLRRLGVDLGYRLDPHSVALAAGS